MFCAQARSGDAGPEAVVDVQHADGAPIYFLEGAADGLPLLNHDPVLLSARVALHRLAISATRR